MKRTLLRGLYSPELLETRIAPATFIVTSLLDDGTDTAAEFTLREAIDTANLAFGPDTIVFDPAIIPASPLVGTSNHALIVLSSQILISDTLTIKGPGVDKLVISGDDSDRIFDIDDSDTDVLHPTTISGIAFQDGNTTTRGGAIRSTESLTLKNTVFSSNYADGGGGGAVHVFTKGKVSITSTSFLSNYSVNGSGGALYAKAEGGITIAKSLVSGNSAPGSRGGGLYLFVPAPMLPPGVKAKPAHIVVDDVTFLGNTATSGGGMWAGNESVKGKITVKNSTFTNNSAIADADAHGGALYLDAGIASVTGSVFSNNSATGTMTPAGAEGGALFASSDSKLSIKGSRFDANTSSGEGGAVHLDALTLASIAGSVFSGNGADFNGGAISTYLTTGFTITGSTLAGNGAGGFGGGIILFDADLVLKGSTVTGNSANADGGGIYAGGGGTLTVSGGTFTGNRSAGNGGGIATAGVMANTVDLSVTGTKFTGNFSNNGGAIFTSGDGEVLIKGVKALGNLAVSNGGALDLGSTTKITVSGGLFARNQADLGGGLFLEGTGTIVVTGSSFLTNSAISSGGGVFFNNTAIAASLLKSKVTGNVAGITGGGIYAKIANIPSLTGSVITGNFASDGTNIYLV